MNQRGFVSVAFLALMPLLLAFVALASAVGLILKNDSDLKHVCRTRLLRGQEKAAKALEELSKLNRLATRLRARRARARALSMSPLPQVAAAARIELAIVTVEQTLLASKQKLLIAEGQSASRRSPTESLQAVREAAQRAALLQRERSVQPKTKELRQGEFALIATPKDSLTPSYEPAPDFALRQTTRLEIEIPFEGLVPDWLSTWIDSKGLKLKTRCVSTLEKEGKKWQPKLKADKS